MKRFKNFGYSYYLEDEEVEIDSDLVVDAVEEEVIEDSIEESVEELNEDVIDTLKKIVKDKQAQKVKFDNKQSTTVDLFTASALVAVYDKVNKKNQDKIKRMANKSSDQFMKVVDVAMKMVK